MIFYQEIVSKVLPGVTTTAFECKFNLVFEPSFIRFLRIVILGLFKVLIGDLPDWNP